MRVHIFAAPGNKYGFSRDIIGDNLPANEGPWRHFKIVEIYPGRLKSLTAVDENDVVDGLLKQGYYLTEAGLVWDKQEDSAP
jgi:hypothetical protein